MSSFICKRFIYAVLVIVSLLVLLVCFIIPASFYTFPSLMKNFIFEPGSEIPDDVNYEHPEAFGFDGGINFYLTTDDNATLGVWHTLPTWSKENLSESVTEQESQDWLNQTVVVLYMHGSAGTRTSPHRLRLYDLLNKINCHVIAFDYRGYGDSTGTPTTETDVVNDAKTVFKWIQENFGGAKIYLWGHSLGTGVASHLADDLAQLETNVPISGIVLESPFNNMAAAVRADSLAKAVSFLPWFEDCFINPFVESDLSFDSDKHLSNITTPVLILHAEDDKIISINLANELFTTVSQSRKDADSVQIIRYAGHLKYGHYDIPTDPNINTTIKNFIEETSQKDQNEENHQL